MTTTAQSINQIYQQLLDAFGPQHWWPADSPTEVIIGAILTQNTAWKNVERAIQNLKRANAIDFAVLRNIPDEQLSELIRPAGTFRIKTKRLRAFMETLFNDHAGSLEKMLDTDLAAARNRLLAIAGIGPETADAILLYAANKPTFVVDAYTGRILRRHFLINANSSSSNATPYNQVQTLFQDALPPDPHVFNEYHALLVVLAKTHCRSRATCDGCPLANMPHDPAL